MEVQRFHELGVGRVHVVLAQHTPACVLLLQVLEQIANTDGHVFDGGRINVLCIDPACEPVFHVALQQNGQFAIEVVFGGLLR